MNDLVAQALVGQVLDGKYHLKQVLGAGAFGLVLQADYVVGGQPLQSVAVKLIPYRAERLDDQLEELRLAVGLSHPSLVRCLSAGESSLIIAQRPIRFLFLVMELGT